eukprot:scaffold168031_cov17-Prasinocladus_malaysianus.AAC.1
MPFSIGGANCIVTIIGDELTLTATGQHAQAEMEQQAITAISTYTRIGGEGMTLATLNDKQHWTLAARCL